LSNLAVSRGGAPGGLRCAERDSFVPRVAGFARRLRLSG